jgi:hypothetical protein
MNAFMRITTMSISAMRFAVLAGFLLGLLARPAIAIPPAQGAEEAPWGLWEITTPDLNRESFFAALPESFSSYARYTDEIPGFSHAKPSEWASESHNVGYFPINEESGPPTIIVNASLILPDTTSAQAIQLESEKQQAISQSYEIEQIDVTANAIVPFVISKSISRLDTDVFTILWGAQKGTWVFRIDAPSSAEREFFVRTIVTNLQTGPTSEANEGPSSTPIQISVTAEREPPSTLTPRASATPKIYPTRTATPILRQSPTPRPTSTSKPTQTPKPMPTATPNEATDVSQSEAAAIQCLERFDAPCAARVFEEAFERHPNSSRLREDLYYAYLTLGIYREEHEDISQARKAYEQADNLMPIPPADTFLATADQAIERLRPYARILEGDGFHPGEQNFITSNENGSSIYYADDGLVMRVNTWDWSSYYFLPSSDIDGPVAMSIDATPLSDNIGTTFLQWGDPNGSFFRFDYSWVWGWSVSYYDARFQTWETVIPATSFFVGPSVNLEVRVIDDHAGLYLNGTSVATFQDDRMAYGQLGFGVSLPTPDGIARPMASFRFDNLRVYAFSEDSDTL